MDRYKHSFVELWCWNGGDLLCRRDIQPKSWLAETPFPPSLFSCVCGWDPYYESSNLLFMTNPIVQSKELGSIAKIRGEPANNDRSEASEQKGKPSNISLHVCRISCSTQVWQEASKRQKHECQTLWDKCSCWRIRICVEGLGTT